MVTIVLEDCVETVPPEIKTFTVHKSVVCYHSRMLEAAFSGSFIEGQSQSITLKEVHYPYLYGYIQAWMYTGSLDSMKKQGKFDDRSTRLFLTWVLADRLIMPELQNALMSAMFAHAPFPMGDCHTIYQLTTPDSKLRKWLVEGCAASGSDAFFSGLKHGEEWVFLEIVADAFKILESRPGLKLLDLKLEDYLVIIE